MVDYDFSGWATRANLKCSDGRTIMKNAFAHNDGQVVPLVWNHQHNDLNSVIGKALLENRDEGVYAYCKFNDTETGQTARLLVKHGDVNSLSIYANQLKQNMSNVIHGNIRELSLVLAGANPGAYIDSVIMHGEESSEEAIIYTGENIYLSHSDTDLEEEQNLNDGKSIVDIFNTLSEKQKNVAYFIIGQALEGGDEVEHSYYDYEDEYMYHAEEGEETVGDIFDTFSEEQKEAVYAIIGSIIEDDDEDDEEEDVEHSYYDYEDEYMYHADEYEGGNDYMKHNVFDNTEIMTGDALSHSQMATIISDAKRYGSLKESFLAHAEEYGIDQIEYLFPEARNVTNQPTFIQRDMGWVSKVMGAVSKNPFSRIKSTFADITEDEARAKGYMKGNYKKEEVFSLLKRTTTPTTVYKKQKLDRDDVVDITDFDVVAWLKSEMRMMLDEEIARAILIGDGRLNSSDDKIKEDCIRPIVKDEDLFNIKAKVTVKSAATDDEKAKAFIRAAIKARKNYKGSGEPTLYTTEDIVTDCLLLEDTTGRTIYESVQQLATKLRVKEIVIVPVMENQEVDSKPLMGVIVNLNDYKVGADKGGAINMFDDFDIDYNQQKYLIETRCSGALVKPYSAITLTLDQQG